MKIVRVRISGWSIQNNKGEWLLHPVMSSWTYNQASAHIFRRLVNAEAWVKVNG